MFYVAGIDMRILIELEILIYGLADPIIHLSLLLVSIKKCVLFLILFQFFIEFTQI